jgi:hypothetical protein
VFKTPRLLDILPNPSPKRASMLAYITQPYPGAQSGNLFWYDLSTKKAGQIDPENEYTCMAFSHDGDTVLMCTRSGEAMYYDLTSQMRPTPTRRAPPIELPQPEDDAWWSNSPPRKFPNDSYPSSPLDRRMEPTRHLQSPHSTVSPPAQHSTSNSLNSPPLPSNPSATSTFVRGSGSKPSTTGNPTFKTSSCVPQPREVILGYSVARTTLSPKYDGEIGLAQTKIDGRRYRMIWNGMWKRLWQLCN